MPAPFRFIFSAEVLGLAGCLFVTGVNADGAQIGVDSPSVIEGNGPGSATLNFTLTRSGETNSAVTLRYRSDDGTATAPGDYTAIPPTTITLAAGQTSATIPVTINGDTLNEGDESLFLHLTGVVSVLGAAASYAAASHFAVGGGATSVAAADVNGDGRPDLAVANGDSNNVSVLLNITAPGASTLSYAPAITFAVGSEPAAVAATDVDGDGRPDLAVTNFTGSSVSVLLNTTAPGASTASYATASDFAVGGNPISVTNTDVNGDGLQDLAVANYAGNVSVLLNTTAPGASTPSYAIASDFAAGSGLRSIIATDVNGDGLQDLAVANFTSNDVSVLLNTTLPGASTPGYAAASNFRAGSSPTSVTAADVDGDGRPDLAVANYGGNVSVLLNTTAPGASAPGYSAASDFTVGSSPISVTATDVNGDGFPDLAVANQGSADVSVLLNTTAPGASTPGYAAASNFTVGSGPASVTVVDVNSDGLPDLAVANQLSDNVSVLLNTAAVFDLSEGIGTIQNDDDTTPDVFIFTDALNVPMNSTQTSNTITPGGYNHAPIGVSGGEYSIGCTGTFTSAPGTITSGETVCVRHTSSASPGTATDTTLSVGGVSDTFTSITPTPLDPYHAAGSLGLWHALLGLLAVLGCGHRRRSVRNSNRHEFTSEGSSVNVLQ